MPILESKSQDPWSSYEFYNQQADRWADSFHFWDDLSSLGATQENRYQDRYQQKASDAFNLGLAREQMGFQERMDNTKYQRAAKDLAAVGFSPLALLSNSVGSAPSGASASYTAASKTRGREKSGLGDLASLAIRVLGLIALKH